MAGGDHDGDRRASLRLLALTLCVFKHETYLISLTLIQTSWHQALNFRISYEKHHHEIKHNHELEETAAVLAT